MARRTTTATVAKRRQRTAVTSNAGLSEYGSRRFGVMPDGGEMATTGWSLFIRLLMLTVNKAVECHV